jgi:hypothetical protein
MSYLVDIEVTRRGVQHTQAHPFSVRATTDFKCYDGITVVSPL